MWFEGRHGCLHKTSIPSLGSRAPQRIQRLLPDVCASRNLRAKEEVTSGRRSYRLPVLSVRHREHTLSDQAVFSHLF